MNRPRGSLGSQITSFSLYVEIRPAYSVYDARLPVKFLFRFSETRFIQIVLLLQKNCFEVNDLLHFMSR